MLNQTPGYSPTLVYEPEYIEGFSLLIHPDVASLKSHAQQVRAELQHQLQAITRVVPATPLRHLRAVRIWVELENDPQGAAVFHYSADWLRQNNQNPDKAGNIELSNTRNFLKWSENEQPWLILHELTHAYHFSVLGEHHAGVNTAYRQAMEKGLYQSVPYIRGGSRPAYATVNAREYFAELSEAYFGLNDHYPFRRNELIQYDPVGYQLMVHSWGVSGK